MLKSSKAKGKAKTKPKTVEGGAAYVVSISAVSVFLLGVNEYRSAINDSRG